VVVPERPFSVADALVHPDRVVLKFREGIAVRLIAGGLVCEEGVDLAAIDAVLGDARIERLFTRPVDVLDRERAQLQALVPANEEPLADLNNYFRAWTSGAAETERIVNLINDDPLIETAYAEYIPIPAQDLPPPTPDFGPQQAQLRGFPGINYLNFESVVGARFPNGRMAHLEGAWIEDHEDCSWLQSPRYLGLKPTAALTKLWEDHGAACVGVMAGGRNPYGIRGIASDTRELFLISLANGSANMVNLAEAVLEPGDVMSTSFVYRPASSPEQFHAPRDFPQADWDAVRSAATKGIHYTFAAGNSNDDIETDPQFRERYAAAALSSGGYICGATWAKSMARIPYSNYGSTHVIANGWGEGVLSMGWGHLFGPNNDKRQYYTNRFGGTSSAAATVAGVIASYVGAVKEQNGKTLLVAEVKAALRSTGTPSTTGNVGNRPDLGQLLGRHGLPDGLLVTTVGPPGTKAIYRVRGEQGSPAVVLMSLGRGDTPLGLNRPLLIHQPTMVVFESFTLWTGTSFRGIQVPNQPQLSGIDLYMQVLSIRQGSLTLSNSASLWIQ